MLFLRKYLHINVFFYNFVEQGLWSILWHLLVDYFFNTVVTQNHNDIKIFHFHSFNFKILVISSIFNKF